MNQCGSRAPKSRPPDGWTVDAVAASPRWEHTLEPEAQCELEHGHGDRHRAGLLLWWDPPIVLVGGEAARGVGDSAVTGSAAPRSDGDPVRPAAQLRVLPGESFEDIFGDAA